MDYVNLGSTGLKVSRLCLGCMTYGISKLAALGPGRGGQPPLLPPAPWEAGINFFDTADMYSDWAPARRCTGRALLLSLSIQARAGLVVATKVFNPMGEGANDKGLSRKHIMKAVDASLKRLGTDYIDLYQIHRFDYDTPVEETMEALHDVVRAGKARYIGASSMYAWQFARMNHVADLNGWTRFVSMQPQYNLVYREEEREMLPLCEADGVGVIPWSPLARGFLAGDRKRGGGGATTRSTTDAFADKLYGEDSDFDVAEAVGKVAKDRGVANMQVALAWVLSNPAITAPIIGASKAHHIPDAIAALDLALDEAEKAALEAPYRPKAVKDHD